MTLFEAVNKRYSYRGEFQDKAPSRDDLQNILEAGLAAPSGCNAQTTYLIGVDDPEIIKKMAALLSKPKLASAPAGICVVTHSIPSYRDMYFNIQDYSAAIENMLLAISALGYASCWIEGEITSDKKRQKSAAELLGIPDIYTFVAWLPVGIPESPGKRAVKKAFKERAFYNRWG